MQLTKYKLGDLIVQRREKNKDYDLPIRGVSREGFIKPKVEEADTSIYNVFYKNDFVFNPARMELNSIALNLELDKALCSSLYEVFYVKDENVVLPEFLNLHIKRDEFARHCDYIGLGSAREYCRFANIAEFDIKIPPIEVQREIVKADRQIKRRIRLNEQMIEKLEATAQALYRKMFVDGIDKENLPEGWRMGTLGEYAKVRSGYAFPSEWWQKEGIPVIKISNIVNNSIITDECDCVSLTNSVFARNYIANTGDIVIAMTGATLGKIAIVPQDGLLVNQRVGLFDLGSNPLNGAPYLYWMLQQDDVQNEIVTVGGDSAQANVSNSNIENIEIAMTEESYIEEFNKQGEVLLNKILLLRKGNSKLTELQSLLFAKMGQ